jgi:hypothetical protein
VATIEDYQTAAPFLMALGEFTVNQIENKFVTIPDPPSPGTPAPVTKQVVIAIFEQLFNRHNVDAALKNAGGYGPLGKQHGITKQQAKTIVEELRAMYAVYVVDQGE